MKPFSLALCLVLFKVVLAVNVTEVSARQDWPWSPKVYLDCTLSGEGECDLDVSATWRGRSEPLALNPVNGLSGNCFGVSSGVVTLVWDPREAGFSYTLSEVVFSVNAVTVDEHTFLVLDLVDGTHEWLPSVPDGGWTSEHKTTKMVFRRVPKGTFKMGISSALKTFVGGINDNREAEHNVTISHDYYLAIFPTTGSQASTINTGTANVTQPSPASWSFNNLRGQYSDGVSWPSFGYTVSETSLLKKLRDRFSGRFLFDLPTEAMWERAARAESEGLWYAIDGFPGGGTVAELGTYGSESTTNFLNAIASWYSNNANTSPLTEVGLKTPNKWGIYDMLGQSWEWCLDRENLSQLSDATDPVGGSATSDVNRMRRGGYATAIDKDLIIMRRVSWRPGGSWAFRFAIHLHKLVD
jgi:formylglycine-generating enzyme required for sulfatase activity